MVATWLCGYAAMQLTLTLILTLRGYTAMWLPGYAATWLQSYVATELRSLRSAWLKNKDVYGYMGDYVAV